MGSYTGTPPSFLAGEILDADKLAEITDYMNASVGAWTSYTPTLLSSAGSPAVGNGTLAGRYRRLGKHGQATIGLTRGSTTSFGTGFITFGGLPFSVLNTSIHAIAVVLYDTSAGAGFAASGFFDTATVMRPVSSGGNITATAPFTWATADQIFASIIAEIA